MSSPRPCVPGVSPRKNVLPKGWSLDRVDEPASITRLLHARCQLVSTWDEDLWPVGTRVLVASVEFSGEWGVIIERIDDYPADWPWNEADPVPFIEINRFLRSTEPLEVAP